VWNDYWRTTQKTIATTTTNTNNNLHPRTQNLYVPNPYQQPPQITTTNGDAHDARLPTYKQLLLQQQQQQQLKQLSLGNGDKNEDPLAALLKNKYYHSGPQELKTVDRPQSSSKSNGGGPYGKWSSLRESVQRNNRGKPPTHRIRSHNHHHFDHYYFLSLRIQHNKIIIYWLERNHFTLYLYADDLHI